MKNIYFIGIGGIHMNGMARLLRSFGHNVSGSDAKRSEITDMLSEKGITVFIGHDASHITPDIDTVVYTAAVPPENPELARARELRLNVVERAETLGDIMKDYENVICVAGCHGKTTATSMLTDILTFASPTADPTCVVGGEVRSIGDCLRVGGKKYFIAESCEYYDAFLRFNPTIGVILNVELDHADYFGNLERVRESFKTFAEKTPENGALVINADIDDVSYFTQNVKGAVITFGKKNNPDWTFRNVVFDALGRAAFDAIYKNSFVTRLQLSVTGEHNIYNALASLAVCRFASQKDAHFPANDEIYRVLSNFIGAKRRYEYRGVFKGAAIFDDYSHHPTEVRATVQTALKTRYNKLWCVFQPHTKRRTIEHLDDFAAAFDGCDNVLLLDIYNPSGREETESGVSSKDLAAKICEKCRSLNCLYVPSFDAAVDYISDNIAKNDLLITMGAGDVYTIADNLLTLSTSYRQIQ